MKNNSFRSLLKLTWIMLMALLVITSCKKDDDDKPPVDLVEDGFYVKGAGTALTDFDFKGLMKVTRNEVLQEDRSDLLELYVPVKAGTQGFNIVEVSGKTITVYGPGTDFAEITGDDRDNEEPNQGLWKGSYIVSASQFTVPEDALYHVVIDTELGVIAVAKVLWGIIGAATPNGWDGSTELPVVSGFDLNAMEFKAENVIMKENEWKFRYSNGWKIILDSEYDLGGGKQGIKVNTNLGESITNLLPGGGNIANAIAAKFTISLKYSLSAGYTASITKTGELDVTDWSNIKFDLFGTSISADNTTAITDPSNWGWGNAVSANNNGLPAKVGFVYTYSWTNVKIDKVDGEGFAARSIVDGTYNKDVFRYAIIDSLRSDLTVITSTTNGFGDVNFNPVATGNFDVYLVIDAENSDKAKLTVVETGGYFGDFWTIIGDATPKAWVDFKMLSNADGTEWTWTGDLVAGGFKFRKNADWGEQIGFKSADATWYFDGNADAYVITEATAGNYTIVLNSVTPSATVTKN